MRISKTKKFLTIILSISLLFSISCGDRPTGSDTGGSGKGDALVNSVPKASGSPTQDFSGTTTYSGTLNIVDTKEDTDFSTDYLKNYGGAETGGATREEVIKKMGTINVTLDINTGSDGFNTVALKEKPALSESGNETKYLENATLNKDSDKYNAENPNNNDNYRNYIEFSKSGNDINIKLIQGYADNSSGYDYGFKITYTGSLQTGN